MKTENGKTFVHIEYDTKKRQRHQIENSVWYVYECVYFTDRYSIYQY